MQAWCCNSILDYRTEGKLVRRLRQSYLKLYLFQIVITVTEWEKMPDKKFDIVTSFDVLEHVEPSSIDSFFSLIKELTSNFSIYLLSLRQNIARWTECSFFLPVGGPQRLRNIFCLNSFLFCMSREYHKSWLLPQQTSRIQHFNV